MFWVLLGSCAAANGNMTAPYVDPIFGPLSAIAGGNWRKSLPHGGASVVVDLDIDQGVDPEVVGRLTSRLRDLARLDAAAREAMRGDAESEDSAVLLYRDHHAEELSAAEQAACFGQSVAWKTDVAAFVAALRLKCIWLSPEDEERPFVLDFTIGEAVTQYLIVVSLDAAGEVVDVAMES